MTLDEFKAFVTTELEAAQRYVQGQLETLPDSNLFRSLTMSCYNPVDVKYCYERLSAARLVEIADLSGLMQDAGDFRKLLKTSEQKHCFHNAYQLSWNFGWDYCEGVFIDGST